MFNLFVNSSTLKDKMKFVKIIPKGEILSVQDLGDLKAKYFQLYVSEDERRTYLRSLSKNKEKSKESVANVIKESAIKYLEQVFDEDKEFSTEVLVRTISDCKDAVESMIDLLQDYTIDSLRGLIGHLSSHDFYTYDHSINVSMYCISILRSIKPEATRSELLHVGLGGLLHDLGKIKIPTKILNSPKGLTSDEYQVIKKHPHYGNELVGEKEILDDIDLQVIKRIIYEHHENVDGTGYPRGLKNHEIHFFSKICAIADFFDAITTKRSYSDVMPISKALEVMKNTCGKKIDEDIFNLFLKNIKSSDFKIQNYKNIEMDHGFDPSIPYEKFPLIENNQKIENTNFGKIKILEKKKD